ncbi:D-Ala-D-Ala dipeptidase VanX [Tenacibaculum skagerrakense]|uniref:D-alanyl-D-alanine dipeptidase n=1 Tax=Tenacibaculum skagerrakense TaxID=186571 RepID=A0A4R2NZE8_9FLAO|nr:M15 family metallopeptidase [Tenacibaculum skagerrakense]TCP26775.1 D-Ala-D-Ala dipeptidase VanX [Tenacibaculum skagerrakense]
MKKYIFSIITFSLSIIGTSQELPKGFSYVKDFAPSIQKELRYCSHNNFMGVPVDGYEEPVLITSTKTAIALAKVQKELVKKGLSLKVFDAYRPQTAVNHFVRWARIPDDTLTKKQYYPDVNKRHLFKLGYIATKSGHSRGSSVDLTIVHIATNTELDMGSPYDFFGVISHPDYKNLTKQQKANRYLLRKVMVANGFRPYKNEWWHFTLNNEPFPKTYFDFPIK